MDYSDVLRAAREKTDGRCAACPVCDGRACAGKIPGPGDKGIEHTAEKNFSAWRRYALNMNPMAGVKAADTGCVLFGRRFALPVFAGPVGAVNLHYSDAYDDLTYNETLTKACAGCGIAAFTGDGTNPRVMESACGAIARVGGMGVPTVKPWNRETLAQKFALVATSGCFAAAMDVDAAGLPFLKGMNAGCKTVEEMREIVHQAGKPLIVKGIMTADGALAAREAGAEAIVVSNHGGRVLDGCAATADVLPEIVRALGDKPKKMLVLADGGIRTGGDVFRALALGADAVLIARPFVTAVYGGGEEGVRVYVNKLRGELEDAMMLCGAAKLEDIRPSMLRRGCL